MRIRFAVVAAFAVVACGSAAPTPTPVGSPLSTGQLKFAVIDSVGPPVYCDRDFYPIARPSVEQTNAIAKYPEIRADAQLYAAIVPHEHLPAGDLTDAQKLVVYRAWKLLEALPLASGSSGNYSFSHIVRSASGSASYVLVAGTVRSDGVVSVSTRTPSGAPNCPICLSTNTRIATPNGDVRVTDVVPGMVVWTTSASGDRVAEPVGAVGNMAAPRGHGMVHLVLADGRELLVSPGHRIGDGRPLGSLATGDALDGSIIVRWELVLYADNRTYDLLPAGITGKYWANGILLSSTLSRPA